MTEHEPLARPVLRKDLSGRLLASLRVRRGLTQQALGAALGMSQSGVDRIESGASSLPLELVLDFAAAMETSGTFVVSLLDSLMAELQRDGYTIVPSPRRRTGAGTVLPQPALAGSILAGYITGWLERHRGDRIDISLGTLDEWQQEAHAQEFSPPGYALQRVWGVQR
jgi:transcriptional regulator with XRE-family HTH domain